MDKNVILLIENALNRFPLPLQSFIHPILGTNTMRRWIEFGLYLSWGWLAMTSLHELGHIGVGCVAGGQLKQYDLRPWSLPNSFFASNPAPLLTLWAGPILGCVVMLALASIVRRSAVWFATWFCVLANGLYLLLGYYSGDSELDSTKIIQAGTPIWVLVMVGTGMTIAGYAGFRSECQRMLQSDSKAASRRASTRTLIASAAAISLVAFGLAVLGAR